MNINSFNLTLLEVKMFYNDNTGSAKANGKEPKSGLGQVFNIKLVRLIMYAMEQRTFKNVSNCSNTNI